VKDKKLLKKKKTLAEQPLQMPSGPMAFTSLEEKFN
jgi:hypothetical protein